MARYRFHPVADLFPLMEGADFAEFVADIKENGLREEIWRTAAGLIVDGRNRYRACELAGVEPRFRVWKGREEELPAFVASMNLHRRHLTDEQRAFIAARMAKMKRTDTLVPGARQKKAAGSLVPPTGGTRPLVTEAVAASTMQVSPRAVERAKSVIKHAPDLEPKVVKGDVSLSAAADEASVRRAGSAPNGRSSRRKGRRPLNMTRFAKGVLVLRRFLVEYHDVKMFAPVVDYLRTFLREQEKGR